MTNAVHVSIPVARYDRRRELTHIPVGPLSVLDGDLEDAATWCAERAASGRGAKVATANLDFVALARKNSQLRADLAASDLVIADGAPVAWLARVGGGSRTRRATGVDMVSAIANAAAARGEAIRFAFYGSTEETSAKAAARIESDHANVSVVSRICPPFGRREAGAVEEEVGAMAAAEPNVVLVALGCPRQERFIAEHFERIPGAVWIGVGGTFDFYAGKRARAPRVFQATGLEWAVRLAQEPRRLWRRYIVQDIPALVAVAPSVVIRRNRTATRL